jgi:hypothetical protein
VLSKLDSLDRGTDKFTETICIPFKKVKNVFIKPKTDTKTVQEQNKEQTETFTGEMLSEDDLIKSKESTSIAEQNLNFYKYLKYILENGQNIKYDEYAQALKNSQYEEYVHGFENDNLVYTKHR